MGRPWSVRIGRVLDLSLILTLSHSLALTRTDSHSIVCFPGNKAFANAFNALVPDCYRFANAKDAVTFVPRLVGFSHVGKRVTLFEDGSARFDDQDADVGDGVTSEDLIKRLTFAKLDELTDLAGDKYKKNIEDTVGKLLPMLTPGDDMDSGMDIDIDQILDAEKEALLGLIEGDGVEEHLEDIYWDRLKDKSR